MTQVLTESNPDNTMTEYLRFMSRDPDNFVSPDTIRKLQAAQLDISRAVAEVARATQALTKIRDTANSTGAEIVRLESDKKAASAGLQQRTEAWNTGGQLGPQPIAQQSDALIINLHNARETHAAVLGTVASSERALSDARNRQLAAEQRLTALEREAQQARNNEIVDEIEALVRRLQQRVPILVASGTLGIGTKRADNILRGQILAPLVQDVIKASASGITTAGIVTDINSSVAGDTRGWQAGNAYWDRFLAALREAARPSEREFESSPTETTPGESNRERAA